jgi:hypothetical protein
MSKNYWVDDTGALHLKGDVDAAKTLVSSTDSGKVKIEDDGSMTVNDIISETEVNTGKIWPFDGGYPIYRKCFHFGGVIAANSTKVFDLGLPATWHIFNHYGIIGASNLIYLQTLPICAGVHSESSITKELYTSLDNGSDITWSFRVINNTVWTSDSSDIKLVVEYIKRT